MERLITGAIVITLFGLLVLILPNKSLFISDDVAEQRYDITTTTLLINWYATERELQYATGDDTISGLSECEMRPKFNVSFCELWLVRPRSRNDVYTFDTIGHELYHALNGSHHAN